MVVEFWIGDTEEILQAQYEELRGFNKMSCDDGVGNVIYTMKKAVEAKLEENNWSRYRCGE